MTDGKIPETADRFRHGNPGALFELRTAGEGVEILRGVGAGDPGEHVNLYGNPDCAAEQMRMLELLADRMARTVDPLPMRRAFW